MESFEGLTRKGAGGGAAAKAERKFFSQIREERLGQQTVRSLHFSRLS